VSTSINSTRLSVNRGYTASRGYQNRITLILADVTMINTTSAAGATRLVSRPAWLEGSLFHLSHLVAAHLRLTNWDTHDLFHLGTLDSVSGQSRTLPSLVDQWCTIYS